MPKTTDKEVKSPTYMASDPYGRCSTSVSWRELQSHLLLQISPPCPLIERGEGEKRRIFSTWLWSVTELNLTSTVGPFLLGSTVSAYRCPRIPTVCGWNAFVPRESKGRFVPSPFSWLWEDTRAREEKYALEEGEKRGGASSFPSALARKDKRNDCGRVRGRGPRAWSENVSVGTFKNISPSGPYFLYVVLPSFRSSSGVISGLLSTWTRICYKLRWREFVKWLSLFHCAVHFLFQTKTAKKTEAHCESCKHSPESKYKCCKKWISLKQGFHWTELAKARESAAYNAKEMI